MDDKNEQDILRLNNKIKHLLTLAEKGTALNQQLEKDNTILKQELKLLKDENMTVRQLNLQYIYDREKALSDRENVNEIFEKQKRNLTDLMQKFKVQSDRNQLLEKLIQERGILPQSIIVGSTSNNINRCKQCDQQFSAIKTLESKINDLENELDESHDIIDGLEFELEEIDFLETEIEKLQEQIKNQKLSDSENPSISRMVMPSKQIQLRQHNNNHENTKERRETLHKKLEILHARQSFALTNQKRNLPFDGKKT